MSETIRWGLLSTAVINEALIGAIPKAARSELVAVASRSAEKAQAYAKAHGIPKAHGSYDALLADPDVDAIYISLPNSLHCEWTVKAAAAGKHVLCEKPLVLSLAELDAVVAAAADNHVTIFEAFANLHHSQTQKVIEIVQSGRLGDLQLITGWQAFPVPADDSDNIRLKPELGGGSLWDLGVYPNSLAIVFNQTGPPVEVWAIQVVGETGVEIALTGQLRFANGVVAQISSGLHSPRHRAFRIVGSEGMLDISEPSIPPALVYKDTQIVFTGKDDSQETIVIPASDPYRAEVEALAACVLDGAAPVIPLHLSRDFLKSVLALYESAATGTLVQL